MAIVRNDVDEVFDGRGNLVSSEAIVRDVTEEVNYGVIRTRARAALLDNANFLSLPAYPANPTTAQRDQAITALIAEAKRSARQRNGIIRLLLHAVDTADDA